MQYRQLGATDLACSVIGLGTGRIASLATGLSPKEGIRLIHAAADLGINLIDTADSYGQGAAEALIGGALEGKRGQFLLASKAGFSLSPVWNPPGLLRPAFAFTARHVGAVRRRLGRLRAQAAELKILKKSFDSRYIETCVEASLQRLRTDYLDLFFLHDPPLEAVRDEELLRTLEKLRSAGRIRFFGVSSNSVSVLEAGVPGISCVQTAVHPACTETLGSLLPRIAAARIGVIGNKVFDSGRLLAHDPSAALLQRRLAARCGNLAVSPQHLLIRFALGQPGVASILTGTTKIAHLRQNVACALAEPLLAEEELVSPVGT